MTEERDLLEFIEDNFYTDMIERTGEFWWSRPGLSRQRHKMAGSKTRGYISISIRGKKYMAHRLVFLWINKRFPKSQIDHIDHNRSNNNPKNLREVTAKENRQNTSLLGRNKSGFCGVSKRTFSSGRYTYWRGVVCVGDGKPNIERLFPFTDNGKLDAVEWVKEKRREWGFHENHGLPA